MVEKESPIGSPDPSCYQLSPDAHLSPAFSHKSTNHRIYGDHLVLNNFLTPSSNSLHANVPNHQVQNQQEDTSSHANFLHVYFFFSYYLCLTPFRLKKVKVQRESEQTTFEIQSYLPQKIICGLANLFAMIRYVVELRRCIQEVKRDNPISFFKLFEGCSSIIFKMVMFSCFWTKQRKFLQVARFLHCNPFILPYNRFKLESVSTIASLCTLYVVIGFVRMMTGSGFLRPSTLTLSWWARRLVSEARYSFFLSNHSHIDFAPDAEQVSSLDVLLAVITGLCFQCRFIAGYFVDVCILFCVLSLWAPVAAFASSLQQKIKKTARSDPTNPEATSIILNDGNTQGQSEDQELVLKQYKALKRLSELISAANGTTILPFISEAVFGYAIFFEDVIITQNHIHRLVLLCFYFCAVSILIFSADVCRKMQELKSWLWDEERFNLFSGQKLMLILHDLSTNSVGITASGIFTVDFYLVGSMISVLITLFIIRLQYQTMDSLAL